MLELKNWIGIFLLSFILACSTTNKKIQGLGQYKVQQVLDDNSLPNEVGKLVGVVKDIETGERLSKGSLFIYSLNKNIPLNKDGSFAQELPAGKYAFTFDSEGYNLMTTSTVLIRTKTSTFLNVELSSSKSGQGPNPTNNQFDY